MDSLLFFKCYRALDTFSTGFERYKGKFSGESMPNECSYFYKSICGLREKTWLGIMEDGAAKVPAGSRRSSAVEVIVRAPVEQRALLQDDSDSDG